MMARCWACVSDAGPASNHHRADSLSFVQETPGDVEWGGLQCEDIILLLLPDLDVTIIVSLCILVSFSQLNATPQ